MKHAEDIVRTRPARALCLSVYPKLGRPDQTLLSVMCDGFTITPSNPQTPYAYIIKSAALKCVKYVVCVRPNHEDYTIPKEFLITKNFSIMSV